MKTIMNLQLFAEGGEGAEGAAVQTAQPVQMPGQEEISAHWQSLQQQSGAMAERYAGFDLQNELENPLFFKLTSPQVGVSVEDAYLTVHHRELAEAVAQGARRELANSLQAGSFRPRENGMGATAPGMTTFDYRNAGRREREAFKKQIYAAASKGEKIYPGGK